jgi:UDP-GlcNAc:undecaprenyl-phosphate GlcNAc-1-phosphate transferase
MEKYLIPFLIALVFSVIMTAFIILFFKKIDWRGRKSKRHIHCKGVSRLGGIVIAVVFNLTIFLNKDLFITPELYGFMLTSVLLLLIGIWDDFKELFWKVQLFSQIAAAILVFVMGIRIYYITNPLSGGIIHLDAGLGVIFSVFLVIIWIVAVMNAINWADGVDGMAGGIVLIACTTIFLLSFRPEVNQPPVAILCAILAGAISGFLIFNFFPSAILAGTSGATFMGFSLAVLAIFAGTKIATAFLVLSLPMVDFFWVIVERIKNKKSIFRPDENHLHHKLIKLGWTQRKIVLCYWGATVIIAAISLNTRFIGKSIAFITAVIIMSGVIFYINKKISLLSKNKSQA